MLGCNNIPIFKNFPHITVCGIELESGCDGKLYGKGDIPLSIKKPDGEILHMKLSPSECGTIIGRAVYDGAEVLDHNTRRGNDIRDNPLFREASCEYVEDEYGMIRKQYTITGYFN